MTLDVSRRCDTEAEARELGVRGNPVVIYDVVRGVLVNLRT
jgi:predicted DsbA family dithiol-disulfide isomerase